MNSSSLDLHPLLSLALLLLGLGVLLFVGAPFLARFLLFLPPGIDPGEPPTLAGVAGEEAWLETEDGVEIHGWWYPLPGVSDGEGGPVVVALHGNAGSIAGRTMLARAYLSEGISVLLLSYRGYGRSEGRPSFEGVERDAAAGIAFAVERAGGANRVVLHGRSLGGTVGLSALPRVSEPPAAFILESSFTSLAEVGRAVYPFLPSPVFARLRGRLDAREALRNFDGPVFVVHGTADRIIPPSMSEALHETARDSRGLWMVEGAGHNDLEIVAGEEYGRRLSEFVNTVTGDR
ncbi:MAG: alpha/beta hydrolase [Gemmatimonadales bacterium]|nr:MAG: alpha/beta hydrolase [Gemmatimonadales bacterium]